ncbi:hypothetical protein DSECCO2_215700 [anaerobic digester metagenome]
MIKYNAVFIYEQIIVGNIRGISAIPVCFGSKKNVPSYPFSKGIVSLIWNMLNDGKSSW